MLIPKKTNQFQQNNIHVLSVLLSQIYYLLAVNENNEVKYTNNHSPISSFTEIQTTLSAGAVVGIVVGVIVVIATVIIIVLFYKWRTLKSLKKNKENVYTTTSVSAIKYDNDIYDAIEDSVSASTAARSEDSK